MTTNKYTQEQYGVIQFIANSMGALSNASMLEGNNKKESLIASFMEELVKYSKDDNNKINIQSSKPILKAALWLLKNYKQDILTDASNANINIEHTKEYNELNTLINQLDGFIININNK